MITRISGRLNKVLDEEVRLQVGGLEYQVLVPEFVRRQLQMKIGEEISLCTSHYFDGNPMQGKVVPRLIGFLAESELDFFELFCTVDKVGNRKALKAMVRPIREIADAIQRQDSKWLTTLPGVGAATAEQMIAKLRRKVTRYAMSVATAPRAEANGTSDDVPSEDTGAVIAPGSGQLVEEIYQALLAVGLNPLEARNRLDRLLTSGKPITSVQDAIMEMYKQK